MLAILLHNPQSPLDTYRWKNRIVIQFVDDQKPDHTQPWVLTEKAVKERDLIIITIMLNSKDLIIQYNDNDQLDVEQLMSIYNQKETIKMILIGKDGGVKWKGSIATDPSTIFNKIDAMPMRRHEMSNTNN